MARMGASFGEGRRTKPRFKSLFRCGSIGPERPKSHGASRAPLRRDRQERRPVAAYVMDRRHGTSKGMGHGDPEGRRGRTGPVVRTKKISRFACVEKRRSDRGWVCNGSGEMAFSQF